MIGIWALREFDNWAVDGRNDLAWLTKFDLGTSTARSWISQTVAIWGHGHECLASTGITTHWPPCRTYDRRGWLLQRKLKQMVTYHTIPCICTSGEQYELSCY